MFSGPTAAGVAGQEDLVSLGVEVDAGHALELLHGHVDRARVLVLAQRLQELGGRRVRPKNP